MLCSNISNSTPIAAQGRIIIGGTYKELSRSTSYTTHFGPFFSIVSN